MANRQYLRSDNLTPRAVLIDHMNRGHALGSRERIMVPVPGGVPKPGSGSGVPDGGITAMLLGAALGALGIAKRYLRT